MDKIAPPQYHLPLPLDKLILQDGAAGAGDRMELDVLIGGAAPAGLACAIELAKLAKADGGELNIGVLEKAEALGEHSLSGAVVNPSVFRELFPNLKDADFPFRAPVSSEAVYLLTAERRWRLPTPPSMRNHGNYIASLCEIVRWLGAKAEELGVNVFTGFPAAQLLVQGSAVAGGRKAPPRARPGGETTPGGQAPHPLVPRGTAPPPGGPGPGRPARWHWAGRGPRLPRCRARRAPVGAATQAASAAAITAHGRGNGRVGREDHPRGRVLLASRASRRRARRAARRCRRIRGCAVAQRDSLRDPVGHLRGAGNLPESEIRDRAR